MAQIPEPVNGIAQAIDRAYEVEAQSEPLRPHLGASIIGHDCDRYIWLSFRWAFRPNFPGRVLRLFDRGQREEARVIAWLERIGVVMRPMGSEQERVSFGWHFGGSIDGIIESGLPEAPTKPHILEIKTHNKKSFDALANHGVGKSKPMHFDQMQVYMLGTGIDRALYFAVCKDDDRIYTERVRLEPDYAQRLVDLAKSIVQADRPSTLR